MLIVFVSSIALSIAAPLAWTQDVGFSLSEMSVLCSDIVLIRCTESSYEDFVQRSSVVQRFWQARWSDHDSCIQNLNLWIWIYAFRSTKLESLQWHCRHWFGGNSLLLYVSYSHVSTSVWLHVWADFRRRVWVVSSAGCSFSLLNKLANYKLLCKAWILLLCHWFHCCYLYSY